MKSAQIGNQYWKRKQYFKIPNEKLYYPKIKILDNKINAYFMGVKFPLDHANKPIYGKLFELDYTYKLHVIDSIKLSIHKSTANVSGHFHFEDCMMRQIDNFIIKDNKLYYFKEKGDLDQSDSYTQIMNKRDYFVYNLGSKSSPLPTDEKIRSNSIYYGSSTFRSTIYPRKTILATTDSYFINFYNVENWDRVSQELYGSIKIDFYKYRKTLSKTDFVFENYFKPPSKHHKYGIRIDDDEKELFFGDMCWHSDKNILYFDNSGYDYRCIWEANLKEKKINKIVPEHDAIHPFFYKMGENKYIAYTELNKIMIAESPRNKK